MKYLEATIMDVKLLKSLLRQKDERDWLDFKRKWKLFDSTGRLNTVERDELIKDVLGLANGNSTSIRKTKYLIIGADDKRFDENGLRITYNVNYQVPSQSEIARWVNDACSPAVVGIETCHIPIDDKMLYVVIIPPSFELHETTRGLHAKGRFSKYTTFMRQDEHTVPASERDRETMRQLKLLFRQEIANPPAIRFGAIIGGAIALIFYSAGYQAMKALSGTMKILVDGLVATMGGIIGAEAGWIFREWNTARYDWRYWPRRKKVWAILLPIITLAVLAVGWLFISQMRGA
jgi:hypothetical protein